MEKIDISSLKKAYLSLKEVINLYNKDKSNAIIRDSMIQRFEYTYSLSLKTIKRYFSKSAFMNENIEDMSFNEMIRKASKMNLIKSDLEKWTIFRQKRNLTSHTYNEEIAINIAASIEEFSIEVEFLINRFKEKLQ